MRSVKSDSRVFSPAALRMARKNSFKTQIELAREVGITLRSYQAWEAGTEPHPHNVLKLAEVLGVEPLAFFDFRNAA